VSLRRPRAGINKRVEEIDDDLRQRDFLTGRHHVVDPAIPLRIADVERFMDGNGCIKADALLGVFNGAAEEFAQLERHSTNVIFVRVFEQGQHERIVKDTAIEGCGKTQHPFMTPGEFVECFCHHRHP